MFSKPEITTAANSRETSLSGNPLPKRNRQIKLTDSFLNSLLLNEHYTELNNRQIRSTLARSTSANTHNLYNNNNNNNNINNNNNYSNNNNNDNNINKQ